MPVRKANAVWEGELLKGKGTMSVESGAFSGKYSVGSRFDSNPGTNPEELIAAAHAGCFSMAFSAILGKNGFTPKSIKTEAKVHIDKDGDGFTITKIELSTVADIPGIDNDSFMKHANEAKEGCPVSRALAGPTISLTAKLA
ncbi:MAG: OsmC family protein [Candidatus Zixiibacteriota bacterium]